MDNASSSIQNVDNGKATTGSSEMGAQPFLFRSADSLQYYSTLSKQLVQYFKRQKLTEVGGMRSRGCCNNQNINVCYENVLI
ncbi:hypothetical protein IV203_012675 [Nitzschia inconspicua]|uniref:Uncharacterized protein n=1 Tax=Nitzschia inconspicua TaxID=303405 RepID=A0A9K3KUA6_9STRA|nr:hypothetical protein IV203_014262 [Nitzschia inconspicua]KAG7350078.1 hypothetical protein IV203_012675 [Nitzschia inconspicua]